MTNNTKEHRLSIFLRSAFSGLTIQEQKTIVMSIVEKILNEDE